MKKKTYAWYSVEADGIIELQLDTTLSLMQMMIRHTFNFNNTMLFLGML